MWQVVVPEQLAQKRSVERTLSDLCAQFIPGAKVVRTKRKGLCSVESPDLVNGVQFCNAEQQYAYLGVSYLETSAACGAHLFQNREALLKRMVRVLLRSEASNVAVVASKPEETVHYALYSINEQEQRLIAGLDYASVSSSEPKAAI